MASQFRPGRTAGGALALFLALAAPLGAQTPQPAAGPAQVSLEEALRIAESVSDQVIIARAGMSRARGETLRARSQRLPQVFGTVAYSRALASEFESIGGGATDSTQTGPVGCGSFAPNPTLPLEERVDSLEHAVDCAVNGNPFAGLGDLPFGRENTWRFGFTVAQDVFSGGRVSAQNRIADAGRRRAETELASTRAQLVLDVTQAYYDAVLSDRLLEIAEATLQQAETTLGQTQLARQVGNQPEFELLRAQVTRDNQRPVVIQRRSDRELAYVRLKLLLNLPLEQPLALTTGLNDEQPVPVAAYAANQALLGDTTLANRAPVRQAQEQVRVQQEAVRIARAQRLPSVSLNMNYGRVGYPQGTFPAWSDFRENWTVGASLSVPLFTGGRLRGDQVVAEANLLEARARLAQTEALTKLDTRTALERLEAARAAYAASAGTVEQAGRAYQIAEIRYREGISTQVELTDSRILLQQAQANRALAARDLQIARARVALLPDLPLNTGNGAATSAGQQFQPQQPPQQPPAPRQQQPAADPTQTQTAFTGAGGNQ
ncbi:MAG TPA: TolC family protein [Longimicrobiaceae bacterium]|nr:TolC family protein [Longimicrobiaceae bacterium]